MDKREDQKLALDVAQKFLAGKISYEKLLDNYPDDTDDKEINELFDLIEHQPKLGGFLGVNQETYDQYNQRIKTTLDRLQNKIKK